MHMEKRKENKRRFNAWLDVELLAKIEEMAKKENRTITNMMETLLIEAVKDK